MAIAQIKLSGIEKKTWRKFLWKKRIDWEFWPVWFFYIPIYVYYVWLAIKARSLTFFSAANPNMFMGGMIGSGKYDVLKQLPQEYRPATLYFDLGTDLSTVLLQHKEVDIGWPLIAKPDHGERGWRVSLIKNEVELLQYINEAITPFLIQEYISYPVEVGIMYYRLPDATCGKISSVVLKEFLSVTGDGVSTLKDLIFKPGRSQYYLDKLIKEYEDELEKVLPKGQRKQLVDIGNHCLGTRFINGNDIINDELVQIFDDISKQLDGFYFGRYDLRTTSIDDLMKGKNIQVIELNGANAEPAHIYDSSMLMFSAYKDLFKHWDIMNQIARINHKRGVKYATNGQVIQELRTFFKERKGKS